MWKSESKSSERQTLAHLFHHSAARSPDTTWDPAELQLPEDGLAAPSCEEPWNLGPSPTLLPLCSPHLSVLVPCLPPSPPWATGQGLWNPRHPLVAQ